MKILFVTPFLPSPARFGGQRRLDGLVRSIAANHETTVLSFNADDKFAAPSLAETQSYCHNVVVHTGAALGDRHDKRQLQRRSLFSHRSYEHIQVTKYREFQTLLDNLISTDQFDIVQVEFSQMAAFRLPLQNPHRKTRFVLDEHNIEFDIIRRTAASESKLERRIYSNINWRKLSREERAAWRRFDGVTVTSDRDAALLKELEPKTTVAVIPNGVDTRQFAPNSDPPDPELVLFFGAMNYFPNSDGVRFFVNQIWPRILAKRPTAKLCLVGPAGANILALANDSIEVTNFVDRVEPYIDRAAVVVVPLRLGGGTRLKVVEAMCKAKPIVSTRIGSEGIDVVHDQHVLFADEPQDFADQVERVLADPALGRRLGSTAAKLAEEKYSWPALGNELEQFYQQLLATPPNTGKR